MLDRLGLTDRDRRNLKITIGIMTLIMFGIADGSIGTRIVTGIVGGLVSGGVFVVITALINAYFW